MYKIIISLCLFMVVCISNAFAAYASDEPTSSDMTNHPSDYYYLYSPGNGLSDYLDIKSFKVELYNPPIYIISFKQVEFSTGARGDLRNAYVRYIQYKYDYEARQVYYKENGETKWELLTYWKMQSGADLVFAIAYNMHFYEKYDKGDLADQYLSGKPYVFDCF